MTLIRKTPLQNILSFLPWLMTFEVISMLVGYFSSPNPENAQIQSWYAGLVKSSLNPPPFIFPIMWTILYGLIAYSLWRIWSRVQPRPVYFFVFALGHMLLNWSWSYVFFSGQNVWLGFIWLLAVLLSAIALKVWARRYDRVSCYALLPYIVWLCFAAYLNGFIVWAN